MKNSVVALVASAILCGDIPGFALADGSECNSVCNGYAASWLIVAPRTPLPINVNWAGEPAWWDNGWEANHLTPACEAWGAGDVPIYVDSGAGEPDIGIVFVTSQDYWINNVGPAGAIAVTDNPGEPWTWNDNMKVIYVNVAYYGDDSWFEEGGTPPNTPNIYDSRSDTIHEIGHALGFGHTYEGWEACGVMTPSYSGVQRNIGPLDGAAAHCYYGPVSVSDIQSFGVQGSGHNVNLSFEIQGGASPNEYATVYVADNPAGPARQIDLLTDHAVLMPGVNNLVDNYRLPPNGSYFYWLDYSAYHGVDLLRSPEGLYPATGWATVTGPAQPTIDAPDIYLASDAPHDLGGSIQLFFYQSTDEEQVDYYNVYRNMYPPGQPQEGEWRYIASVDAPANGYYLDEQVVANWVTQYKISAAHHGNYTLQAGRANEGIWNAMSEQVTTTAINNFWSDQITMLSADTLRVCPAGQDGTLEVDVVMWGSNIAPTPAIPPHLIECYPVNESAKFCDGVPYLNPDEPTDEFGRAALTTSAIGGHGKTDLIFGLWNSQLIFDTLTVYLKSPDVDGSGTVDIVDFSTFGTAYPSPPKAYKWHLDFAAPKGTITLADFAHFSAHNNHTCSGGPPPAARQILLSDATIRLGLEEVVSASNRFLHAEISATRLTEFKAALFHLRSDNPMLEFEAWEQGSFAGRVLATPVIRDGVKEFAIGVLDGEASRDQSISLGRIIYRIVGEGDLALTPRDFEPRAADVLSTSGSVMRAQVTMGDSEPVQIPRLVSDMLAQNRPNPFNPTTTLSYSISKQGRVTLRVFGVDGSLVRTLVDRDQQSDRYDVQWDGTDDASQRVASGVYFYTLKTPLFTSTKKMVLLK